MAATVQGHALPEERAKAAADTERVRKFILKRRGEILADLTPEPPDWPEPDYDAAAAGDLELESFEIRFETSWGTNQKRQSAGGGDGLRAKRKHGEWVAAREGEAGATAGRASPAGGGGHRRKERGDLHRYGSLSRRHHPGNNFLDAG